MSYETVFNTGTQPVVVDDEGRVIGGGEWGAVQSNEPVVRDLLESGALVRVEEPVPDTAGGGTAPVNPSAQRAFDRVRAIQERNDRAASMDKDQLIEILQRVDPALLASLPRGGDGKPAKEDLVEAISERPHLRFDDEARPTPPEPDRPTPPQPRPRNTSADADADAAAEFIEQAAGEQIEPQHITDLPVPDVVVGETQTDETDVQTTDAPTKTSRGSRRSAKQED